MEFFRKEQPSVMSINLGQPLPKEKKSAPFSYPKIVIGVVVLAAVGAAYFFYTPLKKMTSNETMTETAEIKDVVKKVGKLMVLPEGEEPTLATVSDPSKLKDQPFFKNAQLGDKVLLYTKAQKAILYRPTLNKIIEVAPINLSAPLPSNQNE
jgi:hypothetical protein